MTLALSLLYLPVICFLCYHAKKIYTLSKTLQKKLKEKTE